MHRTPDTTPAGAPPARRVALWVAALVLAAAGLGAGAGAAISPRSSTADEHAREISPRGPLLPDEQHLTGLFAEATPSVAHITTLRYVRRAFSRDVYRIPQGSGSGFVWDDDGHIVTNYHVVQNSQEVQVVLSDGEPYPAEVVGVAPFKDLAVVKIDAPTELLRPIPIGSSSDLLVGQSVYAIGNPFGLDQSLTRGVISALGREITSRMRTTIYDVIQSDAAVNPGNSGGPLLDSAGRLIGVNTAIFSPSGASAGISFSIPSDTVRRIVPDLIAYGEVQTPVIGFRAYEDPLPRAFPDGVLVIEVPEGSALERAGLRGTTETMLGDLIVAVNDRPTESLADLRAVLERYRAGDEVKVTLVRGLDFQGRGGERMTIETQLRDAEKP